MEALATWIRANVSPERRRFLKFCIVGGSGVVVNMAFFLLVHALATGLGETLRFNVAQIIGFAVSCLSNFLLNDLWTWGDREKRGRGHFFQRLGTYYVVSLSGYGVQAGVGNVLIAFTPTPAWFANFVGIGAGTVFNFVLNNLVTFRKR